MTRRVVVFGSDAGLRIWGDAVDSIPRYEAVRVALPTTSRVPFPIPVSSIEPLRRAARGADAVLALSTLLGAAAAVTTRRTPVVAIDVGGARLVEIYGPHVRWLAAMTTRPLVAVLALTAAHAAELDRVTRRPGFAQVVRQPAIPSAFPWKPDRNAPYLLCAGSSGRDLSLLCDAAGRLAIEVRLVEGGRELIPARGTRVPDSHPVNVVRYGRVSRQTYLDLLRAATALVHPLPRTDYPVGITVLLDAMVAGVPVVATDVPSVVEYQGEGTAAIVPPGDAAAMAEAMQRVIDDEAWTRSMSLNARRHVARIASPAVVGAQLSTVLRELG